MRVAFLLPCAPDAPHGNATTAQRLAQGLVGRDWEISLHGPNDPDPSGADVLVALHAARCGPRGVALAQRLTAKLVILLTGTDLDRVTEPVVARALAVASARVALSLAAAAQVRARLSPESASILVIPQAVLPLPISTGIVPLPETPDDAEILLVLAGIRAIKDPLRALRALSPLAKTRPRFRLWIAGPPLETDAVQELQDLLADAPWATWVGGVPHAQLLPWVQAARIVLSTSRHEGGAPNALLEAALSGTPTLASDIPAHHDFPGSPALFGEDEDLRARVLGLLEDPQLWGKERTRQEKVVRTHHDPGAEIRLWEELLKRTQASP